MQEFDKHEVVTSVQLDGDEQTRRSQTPELRAPTSLQPPLSPHNVDEEKADDIDSEDGD